MLVKELPIKLQESRVLASPHRQIHLVPDPHFSAKISQENTAPGDWHMWLFCARTELLIPPDKIPAAEPVSPGVSSPGLSPQPRCCRVKHPCTPQPAAPGKDQGPALQKCCWRQHCTKLLLLMGSDPVPPSPVSIPLTAGDPAGRGKRICPLVQFEPAAVPVHPHTHKILQGRWQIGKRKLLLVSPCP